VTPVEQFLQSLITLNIWTVVKWLMVLGLGLYAVFAVVAVRQVQLMSRTINGALEWPIKVLAGVHLGIAVVLLLAAVVIL
jgi:hypothetical protein